MKHELNDQSEGNQTTTDVWRQPTRIVDHLQHGGGSYPGLDCHLSRGHLILVKRQPGIAQGRVHVDIHGAVFARPIILQLNPAAKILRDIGSLINGMRGFQQCHGEGQINPYWSEGK